jgi:predicted permease
MAMASYFQDISQDLRYAVRSLRRQPGLVLTATLSAGLGIGVCTVVFGIVNLALFQQLPVQEPERLMAIESHMEQGNALISRTEIRAISQAESWESIAFHLPYVPGALGPSGSVSPAWGSIVSANYFEVARPGFSLGQGFIPGEDDVAGARPKVVLSYTVWRERYGGDESLLGQDIIVNGRPMLVTGVTAPKFKGSNAGLSVDYYLPLSQIEELHAVSDVEITDELPMWLGIGRLRDGVEPAQARAELELVSEGLLAQFPERDPERGFSVDPAGQFSRFIVAAARPLFLLLLAMAAMVLLTACANVANLLLARASMRGPEIATRLALGAGRRRIIRQLLTESVLLASAGGLLGLGFAVWAGGLAGRLALGADIPIDLTLPTDYRTIAIAAALCFAAGIFFGLVPALRSTKTGVFDGLRTNAGASTSGLRRVGLRNSLAMAQIAMSAALLVCSLITIRSFGAVSESFIGGINPDGLSVIGFDPAMSGYDAATGRLLIERILREAEATPGVLSANLTDAIPSLGQEAHFAIEPIAEGEKGERANIISVTPGLLEAVGLRLVDGETFQRNALNEGTLILDEGLAAALFPTGSAVGSTVFERDGGTLRVVGVVETVGAASGSVQPMRLAYRSLLESYTPAARASFAGLSLVLKTSPAAPPLTLISQNILTGADPNLVVNAPRSMQDIIDESLIFIKLPAILFGACGLMGLVIASIGIYGVMSFAVARRFKEFGIRRALGAQGSRIVRDVVSHGATVAAAGLTIGLAGGYGLTRLAESFVIGVNVTDLTTYLSVAAIILAVALAAAAVPAMRAAGVSPSETLRAE